MRETITAVILITLLFGIVFTSCSRIYDNRLEYAHPGLVNMDAKRLSLIDTVITEAIENGKTPGATVVIGRKGKIVYRKDFGYSQIVPSQERMTIDKIFDMASITKPVATATSVMILVEQGKVRLIDPVSEYIPEYTTYIHESGKKAEPIRLYHLLTHTAGLPPYTDAFTLEQKYGKPCPEELIHHIATIEKQSPPGSEFEYSCLGYITLAEIIRRVSGMGIDEFSRKHIFEPLGMENTTFCPSDELLPRVAPTEIIDDQPLRGKVHDPLAQLMDGKSGNAGLFSTADDMAIFAQMLLNGGVYGKTRILSPMSVEAMTSLYPGLESFGRGIGWDIFTGYSSNLGDIFPIETYGHTGFTGTSICIDPISETFVILLTNRVHLPDGDVIALRTKVANIVASSILE